jgi:hypothetical protein
MWARTEARPRGTRAGSAPRVHLLNGLLDEALLSEVFSHGHW